MFSNAPGAVKLIIAGLAVVALASIIVWLMEAARLRKGAGPAANTAFFSTVVIAGPLFGLSAAGYTKDRQLKFAFRNGTWSHFAHASILARMGGSSSLTRAVYVSCLDVSFSRSGGCIAVAKKNSALRVRELLNRGDLLAMHSTDKTSLLNHLIGERFARIPRPIREELSQSCSLVRIESRKPRQRRTDMAVKRWWNSPDPS